MAFHEVRGGDKTSPDQLSSDGGERERERERERAAFDPGQVSRATRPLPHSIRDGDG